MKLKKNTTLYEQFQNPIETSPKGALVHICMTPDIPVLVQTLEEKKRGNVKLVLLSHIINNK